MGDSKTKKMNKEAESGKSLLQKSDAADFEEAISATKFGKYNLLLILISIPAGWSSISEATSMSYVFPAAQCDLNLNLNDKGMLNAITYFGMISSGFIWGYLCDTLGRKKLLCIGLFLDALFVILSSMSQTLIVLMIMKFLGGFIINGPFSALTTYLSEFHCAKYRARIQMTLGFLLGAGTLFLPLLAMIILPANIDFKIFNYITIHSWNVFLFSSAIAPLVGAFAFMFLPETPKFLMTKGRNDEALKVLRLVYSLNTGKPAETYPIKKLIDEKKIREEELNRKNNVLNGTNIENEDSEKRSDGLIKSGWAQFKPLFIPPLLPKMLLVCGIQMLFMMSLNTLRLWLPQLFQAMTDYQFYNNGRSADLCTMLETIRPRNGTVSAECVVNTNNHEVYINSMIVAGVGLVGYLVAGTLINILGKKKLLIIIGLISGVTGYGLYFAQGPLIALALSAIYTGVGSISVNVVLTVVVDLFPTTLRTIAVSLTMMVGRLGGMSGNLVFPELLKTGCAPSFVAIGTGMICCAVASIFLPNTDMKALQ